MGPLDPAVFLHPVRYHDGGVAVLPLAVLVVGVGLLAFGAWQIYETGHRRSRESTEGTADPSAER